MALRGRVLVVAGSDSGAGAGVQADIKTIAALGGYATTAITALTAQNTTGVQAIHPVPASFVVAQMRSALADLPPDAIKTGMLVDGPTTEAVCTLLAELAPHCPLVVDPVMQAKGGAALATSDSVAVLKHRLLPLAALVTPNLPEAVLLAGRPIDDLPAMQDAARQIMALGAPAVLLKGGHLPGDMVHDVLATGDDLFVFSAPRLPGRHTHGTGCTLASAIAAGLAQGMPLPEAVQRARLYVRAAIEAAPGWGAGCGPMDHMIAPPSS